MFEAFKWRKSEKNEDDSAEIVKTNEGIQKLVDKGLLREEPRLLDVGEVTANTEKISRVQAIGEAALEDFKNEEKNKIRPLETKLFQQGLDTNDIDDALADVDSKIARAKQYEFMDEVAQLEEKRSELLAEKLKLERQEQTLLHEQRKITHKFKSN